MNLQQTPWKLESVVRWWCVCCMISSRCLMLPPVPCAVPSNSSVSSTPPDRLPSVWTPTVAWASPSGACAGKTLKNTSEFGCFFAYTDVLSQSWLPVSPTLLDCLHTSVCTRVTSPSWCPRWSLRAMHHCGSQQLASTKSGLPSALTQWWRCAPRAWVLRQRHYGSVCFCKFSLQPMANVFTHQSSDRSLSSSSCETLTCPVCARAWW